MDITVEERSKEQGMKRMDSLRDPWHKLKYTNILPRRREKREEFEEIFEEIVAENFCNMEKEILSQIKQAQRAPYRIIQSWNMERHIIIKLTKNKHKERILKAAREKQQVTYKGKPIPLRAVLSAKTLQARREWWNILKV